MLIQAFSSNNFERIFDIENRKSKVKSTYLSEEYNNILSLIKDLRTEIKQILRKRKCDRTTKESEQLQIFNEQIHKLLQDKKETRYKDLEFISKQVNKNDFQFNLTIQDENVFIIGDNKESFFAIKQLQYNIRKTFNVKQSSRHTILSQIKLLLNEGFPKYVIRTDVINFFESIPQEKLLKKIENNTLLNIQSKNFIKQILKEYNNLKDANKIELDKGIPRGVGISSYLSELYMKDIDNKIRNMQDIIYYARYVDDMFIVISPNFPQKTIREYFEKIKDIVTKENLVLHTNNDKCNLVDLSEKKEKTETLTYLGYKLLIEQNKKLEISTTFGLSDKKKEKIRNRILKSIEHFNIESKYDIRKAREELLLCLRFLCSNTKLNGTKSRVKTGIYYSNDLIDDKHFADIVDIDDFLNNQIITPYHKLFKDDIHLQRYIDKLKYSIQKRISFENGFKEKIYHSFSYKEMKRIKRVLQ